MTDPAARTEDEDDILAARDHLKATGARVLGTLGVGMEAPHDFSEAEKARLLALTPATYIGLAASLAKRI